MLEILLFHCKPLENFWDWFCLCTFINYCVPVLGTLNFAFCDYKGRPVQQYLSCFNIMKGLTPLCVEYQSTESVLLVMNLYRTFFCTQKVQNNINALFTRNQSMGELRHQHNYTGATGSCYLFIRDLSQFMSEWNEAWPQHQKICALLFTK